MTEEEKRQAIAKMLRNAAATIESSPLQNPWHIDELWNGAEDIRNKIWVATQA